MPCCGSPALPGNGERQSSEDNVFLRLISENTAVAEEGEEGGEGGEGGTAKNRLLLHSDERCAVFADRTPHASFHLQCVPRERIRDVLSLRASSEDIALVRHMRDCGERVLDELGAPAKGRKFGFHVPPFRSVPHLHMHCLGGRMTLVGQLKFTFACVFAEADCVLQQLVRSCCHHGGAA